MAVGERPDLLVAPVLTRLLTCFCTALADTVAGSPTCGCCALVADATAWDTCDQGWARVVRVFPSTVLPEQDTSPVNCPTSWAVELELGVLRCACVPDEDGELPDCACHATSAAEVLSDMLAMRLALGCCFDDASTWYVPGAATPVGPDGGCVGAVMSVVVGLPADENPAAV